MEGHLSGLGASPCLYDAQFQSISCLASDRFAIDVQLMSIYLSILSDSQRVQESLLMSNLDLFGFACSEGPRIPRSLLLIVSDIIIAMIMTMTRMILCVLLGRHRLAAQVLGLSQHSWRGVVFTMTAFGLFT